MKANNEARRQLRNDKAVSSVVGTMLMIGIICTLMPIVMIAMGNMAMQMKSTTDATTAALKTCAGQMQNATDYMSHLNYNHGSGGNNSTDPPYIEPEYNDTTQQWDFYASEGHQFQWVHVGSVPIHGAHPISKRIYKLIIIVTGKGSVMKNPSSSLGYANGTIVQLGAIPDAGYIFSKWSGDLTGSINPMNITMNSNKTVYAAFTPPTG